MPDTTLPCSAADAADTGSRLDALDAAAVGLLEPLLGSLSPDAGGDDAGAPAHPGSATDWRAGLANALDRLQQAARALDLLGFTQVTGLLSAHLRDTCRRAAERSARDAAAPADNDAALEIALAEGWVGDAIAFCSGQLPDEEAANLIGRLRDWRGLSARVPPSVVAPIAARLQQDARRIAAATLADAAASHASADAADAPPESVEAGVVQAGVEADDAALTVGADELQMLAEAAGQLGEEFREALPEGVAPQREALEQVADAVERYANAVAYVGLGRASEALHTLHRNLAALALEPAAFDARHRSLLDRLPAPWSSVFASPSAERAREALAPLADAAWPMPIVASAAEAAARAFDAIATIGTRRVARSDGDEIGEADMSLAIPQDADRNVVENLLRELPALSAQFSESIARVHAGSREDVAAAQRIAHTLKGSANTVGVRGIAVLTHELEDLLQLLESIEAPLDPALADVLSDAADCLSEMSEAVAGLGSPPDGALAMQRRVRAWTQRVLADPLAATAAGDGARWPESDAPTAGRAGVDRQGQSGYDACASQDHAGARAFDAPAAPAAKPEPEAPAAPAESAAPAEPVASTESASAAEPAAAVERPASTESAASAPTTGEAAQDWLRVPATLIERLLEVANEASILLSQAQERALEVDRVRATLGGGTDQLQDLAAELERLVDMRGLALSERRSREDFDPLELDEHSDLQMVSRRIAEAGADGRLIEQQLGRNVAALRDSLSQLERLQADLREAALQTRTVRVETVLPRWRRTVRQAARMAGREVELHVQGEETEIDAQLLQALVEPVGHLLRNAVDHGIEAPGDRERLGKARTGRIRLALRRDASDLVVECADDGSGLDLAVIRRRAIAMGLLGPDESIDDARLARTILHPGFSTRERATQLSGRGIGLDVVVQAVAQQRGSIELDTRAEGGTCVQLRLPVRIAALPVIVVRSSTHVLALSVREVERIVADESLVESDGWWLRDGERRWRALRLEDVLGLPEDAFATPTGVQAAARVVLQVRMPGGERVGLVVPEPGQPRSVVLRPLASFLPVIPGLEGATVLGDGAVASVYDLPRLLGARSGARAAPALGDGAAQAPVCLVVDDSVSVRRAMEQFVRDLGYQADSASDGIEALECVRHRMPSLVLVDLEMPRMNGVEFVRALRADARGRAVPVIMITSRSSEKHRALALGAGVDVFLTKPYTEDTLALRIETCLRAREAGGDR